MAAPAIRLTERRLTGQVPDVAVVLPPREQFSPTAAGAIALLVHQATRAPSRHRRLVIGTPCEAPFDDVAFRAVRPRIGLESASFRYAAAIARRIGEPPLIEVHNRPALALHLARLRRGARVSLILHNDPVGMGGLRTAQDRAIATATLAGIVCVSDYLARRLRDVRMDPLVLTNAIDRSVLPADQPERDRLILFVGRLAADKGADSFVAACAQALPQLPGWRAAAIGADRFGPHSPGTPFIAALAGAARDAGVTLSGYLTHAAVLQAIARAAIMVVPSRWPEPFGMVALEAMACGTPLICSGTGGLAELAGNIALPCDPDAPATIADAIRRLVADPALRAERSQAGRIQAAEYGLRRAASRLDAYRAGLLALPRPPGRKERRW